MNKRHLFLLVILSLVCYNLLNVFASVAVSLSIIAFVFPLLGIIKCRNCSKAANYFAIGFVTAVILLYTDIKSLVNNTFNFEIFIVGALALFCGTMCYMIFLDETDNYRLNLKHSKLKLLSFSGAVLLIYLLAF